MIGHSNFERPRRYSSGANSMSSSSVITLRSNDRKLPMTAFNQSPDCSSPSKKEVSPNEKRFSSSNSLVDRIATGVQGSLDKVNRWSQSSSTSIDRSKDKSYSKRFSFNGSNNRATQAAVPWGPERLATDQNAFVVDDRPRKRSTSISSISLPRSSHRPPTAQSASPNNTRGRRTSTEQSQTNFQHQLPFYTTFDQLENRNGTNVGLFNGESEYRRNGTAAGQNNVSIGQTANNSTIRTSRPRTAEEKEKRVLLNKALQQANSAVELDHTQQYAVAKTAYEQACALMGTVIMRSSVEEDRRTLDSIRTTYIRRIRELDQYDSQSRRHLRTSDARSVSNNERLESRAMRSNLSDTKELRQGQALLPPPLALHRPSTSTNTAMVGSAMAALYNIPQYSATATNTTTTNGRQDGEQTTTPYASSLPSAPSLNSCYSKPSHSRGGSGNTEADFDAALDAAVEAVYDEGLEPYIGPQGAHSKVSPEQNATVDLWRRQHTTVRSSIEPPRKTPDLRHGYVAPPAAYRTSNTSTSIDHSGSATSGDAEEHFEAGHSPDFYPGSFMNGSVYDSTTTSSLPRQSDSSGFSGDTWATSITSSLTTIGTSLSTVDEGRFGDLSTPKTQSISFSPKHDFDPSTALHSVISVHSAEESKKFWGDRVESGLRTSPTRNAKQPVANVEPRSTSSSQTHIDEHRDRRPVEPRDIVNPRNPARPSVDQSATNSPVISAASFVGMRYASSPLPQSTATRELLGSEAPQTRRLQSVASDDNDSASPPSMSSGYNLSPLTTPGFEYASKQRTSSKPDFAFRESKVVEPRGPGSLALPGVVVNPPGGHVRPYQESVHTSDAAVNMNSSSHLAVLPLEPCPEICILRPFWLMRCLNQTLTHPKGGYLSQKLFIPREVWKVKNVKVKNLEDKIVCCQLLTAALLNLEAVNVNNAEALLSEMQIFDTVLDQSQANLTKKLGADVGPQSLGLFFRDAAASLNPDSGSQNGAEHKANGKFFLGNSWRKIRSKESATSLYHNVVGSRELGSDGNRLITVPMTASVPSSGHRTNSTRRAVSTPGMMGPNAAYANALAELFSAVEVLDPIIEHVEDPQRRQSSPTYVWLDMIVRHASELFGFYVCRFVLSDVTMLAEKFCKRASEWSQA